MSKPENCIATTPYHKISLCSVHCNIPTVVRIEVNERKKQNKSSTHQNCTCIGIIKFRFVRILVLFYGFSVKLVAISTFKRVNYFSSAITQRLVKSYSLKWVFAFNAKCSLCPFWISHFPYSLVSSIWLFCLMSLVQKTVPEQLVSGMTIQIEIVMQNVYPKLHLVYLFNPKLHLTKINSNHG